jgi:hypothetical protein
LSRKGSSGKTEKERSASGYPFILSLTNRLLMLLTYYHMYQSLTLLGYLFDLSQTSVFKSIKKLEPPISEVLPLPKLEHAKIRKLQTVNRIEAMFPG